MRGKSKDTLKLVEVSYEILADIHPATVRAVCYRLFVDGRIPSMDMKHTKKISRVLSDARKDGEIPWEWIVDETRHLERQPSWSNPEEVIRAAISQYRKDRWENQAQRVEVWSEKGTVRGVLRPVLDRLGVGFRVFHGWNSTTAMNEIAQATACHAVPTIALYVGDFDPSGMYMSEVDILQRLAEFGANVNLIRIALVEDQCQHLASFPVTDKAKDSRFRWFSEHYGIRCYELDAMNPNDLREVVGLKIGEFVDWDAWDRCGLAEKAEIETLNKILPAMLRAS